MMFKPADVVQFHSIVADKQKFHLCLNLNGKFLLINSPKSRTFRGDFVVSCSEIDCLPATESGKSVISCSLLVSMTDAELRHLKAKKIGAVSFGLLRRLTAFVEASPVLSAEDKDAIIAQMEDVI
jgi:hypothetical protein